MCAEMTCRVFSRQNCWAFSWRRTSNLQSRSCACFTTTPRFLCILNRQEPQTRSSTCRNPPNLFSRDAQLLLIPMSLPAIETTCTLTQRVLLPAVFVEKCAVFDATRAGLIVFVLTPFSDSFSTACDVVSSSPMRLGSGSTFAYYACSCKRSSATRCCSSTTPYSARCSTKSTRFARTSV
jgi:hypothetical protein